MKVGDLVNYTGKPHDGPSAGGLILQGPKVHLNVDDPRSKKNVLTYQIYWASHNMINWVMEKHLVVAA